MNRLLNIFSFGLVEEYHIDFKETINGYDYFFRGFRALPAIIAGLLATILGSELAEAIHPAFYFLARVAGVYTFGTYILAFILGLSCTIKRIRAVFPKYNPWYIWGGVTLLGLINAGLTSSLDPTSTTISMIISIGSFIYSMYLLFKNTNLKHKG